MQLSIHFGLHLPLRLKNKNMYAQLHASVLLRIGLHITRTCVMIPRMVVFHGVLAHSLRLFYLSLNESLYHICYITYRKFQVRPRLQLRRGLRAPIRDRVDYTSEPVAMDLHDTQDGGISWRTSPFFTIILS
jgi:hypothetical protein